MMSKGSQIPILTSLRNTGLHPQFIPHKPKYYSSSVVEIKLLPLLKYAYWILYGSNMTYWGFYLRIVTLWEDYLQ